MDAERMFNQILIITSAIAIWPSTILVIIHICKFFKNSKISPQSLATRNLTFYCFLLVTLYSFYILQLLSIVSSIIPGTFLYRFLLILYISLHRECYETYLNLSVTIFKLIMALDVCSSFRKVALYLQRVPLGNQNKRFYAYCFLAMSIPLFYFFMRMHFLSCAEEREKEAIAICPYVIRGKYTYYNTAVLATIRTCRLIPVAGAFWYIRCASINRAELWSRFSLHIRLLVMLGGFAAFFGTIQLYAAVIELPTVILKSSNTRWSSSSQIDEINKKQSNFESIQMVGGILEGIFIGIFFTFRKGTFRTTTQTS